MTELAYAVLIAFASYRLWALLSLDTVTIAIRRKILYDRLSPLSDVDVQPRNSTFLYFWMCPWCLGTWITALITILADVLIAGGIAAPVLVFAAAAAGTGLLGGNDDRLMESTEI